MMRSSILSCPVQWLLSRSFARLVIGSMLLVALAFGLAAVWAQVAGDRGIAPVVSSSDVDVTGIEVDVTAANADEAREKGWRQAQRLAWAKIDGPTISDSQLESLVSAVVIEQERVGPRRYIARLGITFDRIRAGQYLGNARGGLRSAPMLLMPVTISGGVAIMYERRNPWQRAWAEFNPGDSRIDYVRPAGAGGESLLLTYGQTGRRSRIWWRVILDQFGAADVIVPVANIQREWPGGPIAAEFTARYGPDSRYLDGFTLTAESEAQLPEVLSQAVVQFNTIYERALAEGKLRPDPTLDIAASPEVDPALQRLMDIGRAIQAREEAIASGTIEANQAAAAPQQPAVQAATISSYVVQFVSPDAATIDGTLASVRRVAGVRGAVTSSLAIGGTSVMRVSYGGTLDELAQALRANGFNVQQGSNALAISR